MTNFARPLENEGGRAEVFSGVNGSANHSVWIEPGWLKAIPYLRSPRRLRRG